MEKPLKVANNPTLTCIMNFCKAELFSVFLKGVNTFATSALFGFFQGDKYRRSHVLPSDEKVLVIIKLLDPFINEPNKVASGQ